MKLCNNLGTELMGHGDEFDTHQDGQKDDSCFWEYGLIY